MIVIINRGAFIAGSGATASNETSSTGRGLHPVLATGRTDEANPCRNSRVRAETACQQRTNPPCGAALPARSGRRDRQVAVVGTHRQLDRPVAPARAGARTFGAQHPAPCHDGLMLLHQAFPPVRHLYMAAICTIA